MLVVHLVVHIVLLGEVVFPHFLSSDLSVQLTFDKPLPLSFSEHGLFLLFEMEESVEFLDCDPFVVLVDLREVAGLG